MPRPSLLASLALLALSGCNGVAPDPETGDEADADTDADTDSDTDADSDADTDADSDADTDADTDADISYTVCDDGIAPYTNIQDAIDGASEGDVITVCAGEYESISIETSIELVGPDGVEVTLIEGDGDPAVTIEDTSASISGFTLTGDSEEAGALAAYSAEISLSDVRVADIQPNDYSYGIFAWNSEIDIELSVFENNEVFFMIFMYGEEEGSLVLHHSIFRNNDIPLPGTGGGLVSVANGANAEISNNIFHDNVAINDDGIISLGYPGASIWFYNNLIWNNVNTDPFYDNSDYMVAAGEDVIVENNIIASNTGIGLVASSDFIEYNDVWDNSKVNFEVISGISISSTNLQLDPKLNDPENSDFTLDPDFSFCIDAGDPLSGYNDPDGSRNDIGAFGGPYGDWTPPE